MTEAQKQECVALYQKGRTVKDIAETIGYSHVTVTKFLNRKGIETPRKPRKTSLYYNNQDRKTMAILEWQRGQTVPQIARSLKIHPQTVRGWIQKSGQYIPERDAWRGNLAPERAKIARHLDEMHQKYNAGASVRDLAFEYDLDYEYLYESLRRKGVLRVRPRKQIGPFEFIEGWQNSTHVVEVAEMFGIDQNSASNRASYYRQKGVPLKYMETRHDWQRLSEFAQQFVEEEKDVDLLTGENDAST